MEGIKFDKGKTRLELIPTELIQGVGEVLTFGAMKYEADNWRKFKKEDHKRLVGAAMRHLEAYRSGEYLDQESGLPHLAHVATNMGFLLALDKPGLDTWKALDELIVKLKTNFGGLIKPDVILAITRGGLVPATYIAHALGITNVISCKNNPPSYYGTNTHVLIIDDISDSGDTLRDIVQQIKCEYTTATIFKRYNTKFEPDYYGVEVSDDTWVEFPWESSNG